MVNEGTEKRRTAILAKTRLQLQNIQRIPSGRGIAANFKGIRIINIYAPPGTERRAEREQFFNTKVTYLLPTDATEILYDVWEKHSHTTAYTHYTNFGASRIDRICITEPLINQKQGVETVAAVFSDYFAVILRLKLVGHV